MRVSLLASAVVSAALFASGASHAQDAASARAFITSAYQYYNGKDSKGTPVRSQYYHSSFLALIDADIKAAGQNVPICCDIDLMSESQEWDGIWDLKINIQVEKPKLAYAFVSFAYFAPKDRGPDDLRNLKVTLVPEHGQWRIYDILDQTPGRGPIDVRQEIQKEIEDYAKHPNG